MPILLLLKPYTIPMKVKISTLLGLHMAHLSRQIVRPITSSFIRLRLQILVQSSLSIGVSIISIKMITQIAWLLILMVEKQSSQVKQSLIYTLRKILSSTHKISSYTSTIQDSLSWQKRMDIMTLFKSQVRIQFSTSLETTSMKTQYIQIAVQP